MIQQCLKNVFVASARILVTKPRKGDCRIWISGTSSEAVDPGVAVFPGANLVVVRTVVVEASDDHLVDVWRIVAGVSDVVPPLLVPVSQHHTVVAGLHALGTATVCHLGKVGAAPGHPPECHACGVVVDDGDVHLLRRPSHAGDRRQQQRRLRHHVGAAQRRHHVRAQRRCEFAYHLRVAARALSLAGAVGHVDAVALEQAAAADVRQAGARTRGAFRKANLCLVLLNRQPSPSAHRLLQPIGRQQPRSRRDGLQDLQSPALGAHD
mmetsp:Transcript_27239/g.68558  ORF Transcript_27239/g.68558 Transcript_27239/m.68558 type:complete len:266 (-) Transcript_27239:140-937(-)